MSRNRAEREESPSLDEEDPQVEVPRSRPLSCSLTRTSSTSSEFLKSSSPTTQLSSIHAEIVPEHNLWKVPDGKLQVRVIKVSVNQPVRRPYVRIVLGDQIFQTSVSELAEGYWNEGFEFVVTYHSQLFGICQLDLYESNVLFPDKHIGRAEIPLSQLEGMPECFNSYFELWDKRFSPSNITSLNAWNTNSVNRGAIQVRINYRFQGIEKDAHEANMKAENEELDANIQKIFKSRLESALEEESSHHEFRKIEEDGSKKSLLDKEEYLFSLDGPEEDKSSQSSSFLSSISKYLISEETLQVLRGISKLSAAFGQGLVASNVEILAGLLILEKFYGTVADVKTSRYIQNLQEIEYPGHFYKYAMAAYGWRGLHFFGKGSNLVAGVIRKGSDALSIREFLALPPEDLLGFEFLKGQVFQPSYFIALDRSTNSIVLSIRGTMSAQDTLTDLVCEYQPWKGGVVHSGMKSSAQFFMTEIIPQLLAHISEHRVSALYIVGHSLGGSTASVLTMMIMDYLDKIREASTPDFKIQCYAYGPGPSVSLDLAKKYENAIHSYVNENDIICRLSYGSMMDFKAMVLCAAESSDSHLEELLAFGGLSGFSGSKDDSEKWKKRFDFLMEHRKRIMGQRWAKPKLYIAGSVFRMYLEPTETEPNRTLMERTEVENFSELLIRSSMVMDHLPSMYEVAFTRARETLMRGKIELSSEEEEEIRKEHPSLDTVEEQKEEFVKEMENPSLTELPLELGALGLSQQMESAQK